jgi:hypothetical protein
MLDLDVGFIDDPMKIVSKLHNSRSDIFVQVRHGTPIACSGAHSTCMQMDITFIMNRTLEGWRTWYTAPQPNIGKLLRVVALVNLANIISLPGIMLCRGNKKTVSMFDLAWREYKVTATASCA